MSEEAGEREKDHEIARLRGLVVAAYREGWRHGYYDGGEHDCRMFPPTAERAWDVSETKKRLTR